MVTRWRLGFALAFVTAGAIIACGPGFLDGISGGKRDAGADATPPPSGSSDAPFCDSVEAPPLPSVTDDQTAVKLPAFAVDYFRADTAGAPDAGGPRPQGLDLDKTCTCGPGPDSCIRPPGTGQACDGPRGRDNALGELFNDITESLPIFSPTFATDRIRAGHFTILFELLGWNGTPNDASVILTLRQSPELDKLADGGRPEPLFDGQDLWTVDPAGIAGGDGAIGLDCRGQASSVQCVALIRDEHAYVSNGQLVAQPRVATAPDSVVSIVLRTGAGSVGLDFEAFTIVATISGPTGGPYRFDGEMTGRVPASTLVTSLGNLQDFTSSDAQAPLCANTILFGTAKAAACNLRDLVIGAPDNTAQPCNGLSGALTFGAGPAIAGTVYKQDKDVPPCGDAGFTCDN